MRIIVVRANRASGSPIIPPTETSRRSILNDEFDGGEIVIGAQQLVVKPRRGLLLAFPSDAAHVHEVLPVRSGVRYTMPIWFTKQQRFALADFPSFCHRESSEAAS
jgi:hypothetical protein